MDYKENFFNLFHLPIEYLENKISMEEHMKNDLELVNTNNDLSNCNVPEKNKSIYQLLFQPQTTFGKKCLKSWSKYYTNNTQFINDSQTFYSDLNELNIDKNIICDFFDKWKEFKLNSDFNNKYQYISYEKFNWLNESSVFLFILSLYNILSPVINLITPLLILIIPFFILKIMRLPITINSYIKILKTQFRNNSIYKLFTSFNDVSLNKKIYLLFCSSMYIFNFYQNILSCIEFYNNLYFISNHFETVNNYITYTLKKMKHIESKTKNLESYCKFNEKLTKTICELTLLSNELESLPPLNSSLFGKISNIGKIMKTFYHLYMKNNIDELFNYTLGFHGYMDTLVGLHKNISEKKINRVKIIKKNKTYFKDLYHPSIQNKPVKNSVKLTSNKIITGPNAAGKTTLVKSVIINIILSQQIGMGFFKSANVKLYDYLYCYINIPDTNSRDSLFQSESRRCKDILDNIANNPSKSHFCVFDELFSGTNPYEATCTAYSYLTYISKFKNVRFILTTHFIKLCDLIEENKEPNKNKDREKINIKNFNMNVNTTTENKIKYTYKMIPGISKIKGGINVLQQLEYPRKIIDSAKNILSIL
tara:strand:+ start:13345 stop:15123 length:1779 start_codon:yes stop_codon:yes gene_type:complete